MSGVGQWGTRAAAASAAATQHNRSFDVLAGGDAGGAPAVRRRTVYAYSSSDDSLNASFSSYRPVPEPDDHDEVRIKKKKPTWGRDPLVSMSRPKLENEF